MRITAALAAAAAMALVLGSPDARAVDAVYATERGNIRVTTLAGGLENPWGITFFPTGQMLVSERAGRLRIIDPDGKVSAPLAGVPAVDARGQGGLLDVELHPAFATNHLIYMTFSQGGPGANSTAIAAARLVYNAGTFSLGPARVIFTQSPTFPSTGHFGSRLVFDRQGNLFATLGERNSAASKPRAQDLTSHIGKVVRLKDTGAVAPGNPYLNSPGVLPAIWSRGHRNPQGAALNPLTGELWTSEHGPLGGDEINIARAAGNYGWPLHSYGRNYDGSPVGDGTPNGPGMTLPIYQWTPVIGASGMSVYTGTRFPGWRNNLFVSGLAARTLVRLEISGSTVTHEERLLGQLGARIRDVQPGPDGALYVLTDAAPGEVLRVVPAP